MRMFQKYMNSSSDFKSIPNNRDNWVIQVTLITIFMSCFFFVSQVRLIRTNLTEKDVGPFKEQLAQSLFDHIPVGVGSKGVIPTTMNDLNAALEMGKIMINFYYIVIIIIITMIFRNRLEYQRGLCLGGR